MHGRFLVLWFCCVKGFFEGPRKRQTATVSQASNYVIRRLAKRTNYWLDMIKSKPCLMCLRITASALSASWFLNASSMAKWSFCVMTAAS
jgi:hypothetical protein